MADHITNDELLDMLGDCGMWQIENSALGNFDDILATVSTGLYPVRIGDAYLPMHTRYMMFRDADRRANFVGIIEE